ncbi:hypothetical protein [uncultured Gimesia sp.]|uniref:hypothetical protein n=1 Tax=uncultured Gimesia sp. TaxID=1678688 RepID=UPI00262E90B6|nr:hypothetical protein [uncultured Gimesia sp.]
MRLTLRTLIAYLDDVLEPNQIKEIGKKLEESSYASSLVDRIKDVMRRRRLTAPEIEGAGSNPDANTIAEYLDNTLTPEIVADVEKVCLNSDVNLVEVAASHQILTLVLGEPATVNANTRERIYALGPIADEHVLGSVAPGVETAPNQNNTTSEPGQQPAQDPLRSSVPAKDPEPFSSRIPDYLKTKPLWKRFTPYFLILLAAGVWAGLFFGDPTFFSNQDTSTQLASHSQDNQVAPIPVPADTEQTETGSAENQPVTTQTTATDGQSSTKTPQSAPMDKKPLAFDAPPPADAENESVAKPNPTKTPSVEPPAATQTVKTDTTKTKPLSTPPATTAPDKTVALNTANIPKNKIPQKIELADVPEKAPAAQIESENGFFLTRAGDKREFADKNDWVSRSKVSPIQAGMPVASPEPFTARINIPEALCKVVLLPGTAVTYEGKNKAAEMGFKIQEGRIRIEASRGLNDAKNAAGPILSIKVRNELWRIELVTTDSVCGIEIDAVQPSKPGEALGDNSYTGILYTYSGMIRFSDGKGKVQTIDAGNWMSLSAKDRAEEKIHPSGQSKPLRIPRWVQPDFNDNSYLARRSIAAFAKELNDDQLVSLTMPAITKDLKPNISDLGTKSLVITNRYQELVKVLNEVDHHESRITAINGIRNWLSRDPENGKLLTVALQEQFSPELAEIMERLLWGFQKEDAQDRFISGRLVEWLEHPHVAVRELAFNYIHQLTGRPIDYSSIATPTQRRSTARKWFSHIEKHGSLVEPDPAAPAPQK